MFVTLSTARMGGTRVRLKCATAVRLCAARAVHLRHPIPVSAHVCRRLEKLRHLASVRLTCMVSTWLSNVDVSILSTSSTWLNNVDVSIPSTK